MAGRRIQALDLMGRIAQKALEQEAAALSDVRGKIDRLQGELAALHADLQAQGRSRSLEAAAHMPAYLRAVRGVQARIEKELITLHQRESELEAAVSRRFRERKTFERVLDDARSAERTAIARSEAAALDDFAIQQHGLRAAARLREGS